MLGNIPARQTEMTWTKYTSVIKVSNPAEQGIHCQKLDCSSTLYNDGRYSQLTKIKAFQITISASA